MTRCPPWDEPSSGYACRLGTVWRVVVANERTGVRLVEADDETAAERRVWLEASPLERERWVKPLVERADGARGVASLTVRHALMRAREQAVLGGDS